MPKILFSIIEEDKMPHPESPIQDPYLGRDSLFHFDNIIISAMETNTNIAKWTIDNKQTLTPIQLAGCEIIPHGISIALSIRELIRSAYLYSGEILIRPLLERAAVISYLIDHPEKIELWEKGWPFKSRPTLKEMLVSMSSENESKDSFETAKFIVNHFNTIVHADPDGALRNHGVSSSGTIGYLSGPNINDPEKCDNLAFNAQCYLIVLISRAVQIFPKNNQVK
jgi:hypothetical protein